MSNPSTVQGLLANAQSVLPHLHADIISLLRSGRIDDRYLRERAVLSNLFTAIEQVKSLQVYKDMKADEDVFHCVRCHEYYTNPENLHGACVIPHVFRAEGVPHRQGYGGCTFLYTSVCCGGVLRMEADGEHWPELRRLGVCFAGRHTTRVADVDRSQRPYNDKNILPCKVSNGECVRTGVDRARHRPNFEADFHLDEV